MAKRYGKTKRGFTLMELLIVIAIIVVLVAIAIPIFSNQLEKAREATDAANIRAAYAAVSTDVITDPQESDTENSVTYDSSAETYTATVEAVQKKADWQSSIGKIGGQDVAASTTSWTIVGDVDAGTVTITAN